MKRLSMIAGILVGVSMAGCAIVDDKKAIDPNTGVRKTELPRMGVSEQGVVTVATLFPESDVATIPSSISHVVWRRPPPVMLTTTAVETVRKPSGQSPTNTARDNRRVVDNWPVLEEDMNFESEIGRVDMCRADNSGCMSPDCAKDLAPCDNPENYACFTAKQGEYCIETGDSQ